MGRAYGSLVRYGFGVGFENFLCRYGKHCLAFPVDASGLDQRHWYIDGRDPNQECPTAAADSGARGGLSPESSSHPSSGS